MNRSSVCGYRCARARRRPSAASSSSRRGYLPPLEPLRPGGYEFARDMYFQRIGASGFVLGAIRTAEAPHAPTLRLRFAAFIDGLRGTIDKRIRTILPGDKGAIASALITGKRDTISTPVNEAMYTCRASP